MLAITRNEDGQFGFFTINNTTVSRWLQDFDGVLPSGVVIAVEDDHELFGRITEGIRFEPVIERVVEQVTSPVLDEEDGLPMYDEKGVEIVTVEDVEIDKLVDIVELDPLPFEIPPEQKLHENLRNLENSDYRVIRALEAVLPKIYEVIGVPLPSEWTESAAERQEWRDNAKALEAVMAEGIELEVALERTRASR